MKKHKILDLRTARGKKIYEEIASFYPCLYYGWKNNKEYLFAEGYNVIIDYDGKGYIL